MVAWPVVVWPVVVWPVVVWRSVSEGGVSGVEKVSSQRCASAAIDTECQPAPSVRRRMRASMPVVLEGPMSGAA